ncbi:hypothetical protein K9L97_00125 [Candidatus Woesearchaeota archaeon]|nr:hypothetical protein [Candidatus Woesearchaeota archaeon]
MKKEIKTATITIILIIMLTPLISAQTGHVTLKITNPLEIKNVQIQKNQQEYTCTYELTHKPKEYTETYTWTKNKQLISQNKNININEPGTYQCEITITTPKTQLTKQSQTMILEQINTQTNKEPTYKNQPTQLKKITGNTITNIQKIANKEPTTGILTLITIILITTTIILLRKYYER